MPLQPAPSLINATIADLGQHAPFDRMAAPILQWFATRLSLRYYARGEVLLAPADGPANCLFVVQRGSIVGAAGNTLASDARAVTLGEGECFPLGALISCRPSVLTFTADKDTFCYLLPRADFEHVMAQSPPFRDFATRRIATLLAQSQRSVQNQYSARLSDAQQLAGPLKSIIARPPVTVSPETPIREVLELMQRLRIGSVVIVDEAAVPVGIFTERDVLDRVALGTAPLQSPIASVMTPQPFHLPSQAPLFAAAEAMARQRFRHVLVMEEGALIGVVSERDLFTLQRLSLGEIAKLIAHAGDVAALARAASEARLLADTLLAQGVAAEQLTQFVSTLNDAIAARALTFAAEEAPPPATPWCWLALGSEGRMEQTLATDQDNALIFVRVEGEAIGDTRAAFVRFASVANGILDECGFPLCTGDIMAKNPQWCLSEHEWRNRFADWLATPEPAALLNAAIFFDFRALHGDIALADDLRAWLGQQLPARKLFFLLMAQNALQVRPPLGLLRDFVGDDGDYPGSIDLKKYCARPFVDAARIFALKHGVTSTNTAERIRLAARRMQMPQDEAEALVDAFHFVQLLRLQNHRGIGSDVTQPQQRANPNRVNPDELNALDRRILKEALRQARKLQSRLQMDFQL